MKKFTLSFLLLFISSIISAQSFILLDENHNDVTNSTVDIWVASNSSNVYQIPIINTNTTSKSVKVARRILSMNVGDDSTTFCFGGLCYGASTDTSTQSFNLIHNDTVDFDHYLYAAETGWGFHATFGAGHACNDRFVHYIFYNINNPTDSVGVTLKYICFTGIDESTGSIGYISEAYPNPAANQTSVNYKLVNTSQKAKLVLYDMLGKEIKHIALSAKEGTEKLNTADLTSGIYFYSLFADDKMVATKKLIVTTK